MGDPAARGQARTDGYSGRALSKLMISVQGHAYAKDDPTIEGAELLEVVDEKIESYAKRARSAPVALAP